MASSSPAQPATLKTLVNQRSPWRDAWWRFRRNRLALLGLAILIFLFFLALTADIISPWPYDKAFLTKKASTLPFIYPEHPLGLDASSRDYLSRLIHGARTSMMVGLSVPLISFMIGMPLGIMSGYWGGKIDFVIQRLVDVATAIPPLLFALFLLSVTGAGVGNVIFVLAVTGWIEAARLTRAQFLVYREKEFVTAARALGAPNSRLILSHILPNIISPLLISFTLAIPLAIFSEAGLSFLGIGITEPTPSWGRMIGSGDPSRIRVYYHIALFPTLLVALTMIGFSFVGDGLQEALDPNRSR